MDEFEIIARFFAPLATAPFAFGLADDAAAIPVPAGFDLIVTTDQIAEDTDFIASDPADTIARKALLVNLSDLAAKGAVPKYYLLNLALPATVEYPWLTHFAAGLRQVQERYGICLIGGDTSRTQGPLTIAITAFGLVLRGHMVRRNGARVGDDVYVTGTIGDSGGGLAIFRREHHALNEVDHDFLTARYRVPEPPVDFGVALPEFASASVDISDGLVADLGHIALASGVRLVIDAAAIPRSTALRALWGEGEAAIRRAAISGDDYQIAFTAPAARAGVVAAAAKAAGISVTRIGHVEVGQGVCLTLIGKEIAVSRPGYRHF